MVFGNNFIFLGSFVGLVLAIPTEDTLIQTHIILRHGDRAPVNLYPTDPNEDYIWPYGLGQLTNIGKLQQFELGTFLKDRYQNFFTANPQEIQVRSSEKDRCIASAQANLAAFFKPEDKWIWKADLLWQPIPIRTYPKAEDWILNEDATCPAADQEADLLMESPEGKAYASKYKKMMKYVENNSGMTVNDPTSVLDVFGTIFIEKLNNLTIPAWVDPYWEELSEAADEAFVTKYTSKKTQRLRGGPLLNQVTNLMKTMASGGDKGNPKGYMYATHDAIIAALLSAMNVFNGKTVPYCATVLIELYQSTPKDEVTVRVLYRNSTGEAHQLKLPNCAVDCPLGRFERLLQDVTPKDIKTECHLHQ